MDELNRHASRSRRDLKAEQPTLFDFSNEATEIGSLAEKSGSRQGNSKTVATFTVPGKHQIDVLTISKEAVKSAIPGFQHED